MLTDAMMAGYIAALPRIAISTKRPKPGTLQYANPNYVARLEADTRTRGFQSCEELYWRGPEAIAKAHGFPNQGEFIQLSATVALNLTGTNAETKVFTVPKDILEDQIAFLARTIANSKRRGFTDEVQLGSLNV